MPARPFDSVWSQRFDLYLNALRQDSHLRMTPSVTSSSNGSNAGFYGALCLALGMRRHDLKTDRERITGLRWRNRRHGIPDLARASRNAARRRGGDSQHTREI